jgi:outer membrane protein, multidrug efflux system
MSKPMLGLENFRQRVSCLVAAALLVGGCTLSPEPFTAEETATRVANDMAIMFSDQEKVDHPISLEEAAARALKYNLDYRLKLMEKAVALGEADLSHYSLLPGITADAGYNYRSNDDGTVASEGADPSITTESAHNTADLEMTWNVLDFGISYIRAKQQADMALIVDQRRRQVVHNIVKDIRSAFWRVVAAERNLPRVEKILGRVREALETSEKLLAEAVGKPMEHLSYQKDLLDTLTQLEATKRTLLAAKTNLAALMNIHPSHPFTLAVDDSVVNDPSFFPLSLEEMENVALAERTELQGEAYQSRIFAQESKVAILRMLPGLNFSAGLHFDDDHYLLNNSWGTFGASLTWNLLNVIKLPATLDLAENQEEMSNVRRLALSMAVISQVNVSALRYASMVREYGLAKKRFAVEDRMRAHSWAARQAKRGGELAEIQGEVRSLQARLRRDLVFANVQEAYGGLFATMGVDPLPETMTDHSLSAVGEELKRTFGRWDRGEFGGSI